MPAKTYRLLTNLESVSMASPIDISLHCHALVLETNEKFRNGTATLTGRIRGFMTDATLPVFNLWLGCGPLEYTIRDASKRSMLTSGRSEEPLFLGNNMVFADGTKLLLHASDTASPLDVADFDDIVSAWMALPAKVHKYWQAPNMPVSCYLTKEQVLENLNRIAERQTA